jgi:divalent metal cation (Fe/Co/Zn/Cd) transporter
VIEKPTTAPQAEPALSAPLDRPRLVKRARNLALSGNVWHLIEFAIALIAGIAASSVALVAFGLDSVVEAASGFVIFWRFSTRHEASDHAEERAQRLIAGSYFVLAAYIAFEAVRTIIGGSRPDESWLGIGLALVAAMTMPLLARAKHRVGHSLGSRATAREGNQNLLCAYLSIALLIGLSLNALAGWWWADPLAGLVIAAVAVREGVIGWRGDDCC